MLELGWITPSQLRHALAMQRREETKPIGDLLVDECGVDRSLVRRALAMQWGCPVLTAQDFGPEPIALAMPKLLIDACGMLPLRIAAGINLYVAFTDCPDATAAFGLERMSGIKVHAGLVDTEVWSSARDHLDECDFVPVTLDDVGDNQALQRSISSSVIDMQPRASRLVRVGKFYWLRMWLEDGPMSRADGGVPRTKEDVVDQLFAISAQQ